MTVNPLVIDFIKTAQSNGITHLWAYLPFHHPLVKSNQVRQIRVLKGILASGIDELGNRVLLTSDGTVQQWIWDNPTNSSGIKNRLTIQTKASIL